MRVLLEETRLLTHNLAYHRRAKLEVRLELVLYELDRQIEGLRANRSYRVLETECKRGRGETLPYIPRHSTTSSQFILLDLFHPHVLGKVAAVLRAARCVASHPDTDGLHALG
jgi:hypothetical protein